MTQKSSNLVRRTFRIEKHLWDELASRYPGGASKVIRNLIRAHLKQVRKELQNGFDY